MFEIVDKSVLTITNETSTSIASMHGDVESQISR